MPAATPPLASIMTAFPAPNPPLTTLPDILDAAAMSPETYVNPLVRNVIGSLATLPHRAIQSAANYRQTGNYDPGPILEAATLPLGTGAIAGVPMRAGETALGAGLIRGSTPEVRAGEDAMAAIERAISGSNTSIKPEASSSGEDAMAAIERAMSGTPASSDLQSRIIDAVKASGGTGVRISDVVAKLPDVPLKDIHAEMKNLQRNERAVLSNWDDPKTTTAAMKNAAINIGGDPRHAISLIAPSVPLDVPKL